MSTPKKWCSPPNDGYLDYEKVEYIGPKDPDPMPHEIPEFEYDVTEWPDSPDTSDTE
ncbi:MAG: hypothetical protein ACYCPT_09020 [Acidimicrobiales bacterium]